MPSKSTYENLGSSGIRIPPAIFQRFSIATRAAAPAIDRFDFRNIKDSVRIHVASESHFKVVREGPFKRKSNFTSRTSVRPVYSITFVETSVLAYGNTGCIEMFIILADEMKAVTMTKNSNANFLIEHL